MEEEETKQSQELEPKCVCSRLMFLKFLKLHPVAVLLINLCIFHVYDVHFLWVHDNMSPEMIISAQPTVYASTSLPNNTPAKRVDNTLMLEDLTPKQSTTKVKQLKKDWPFVRRGSVANQIKAQREKPLKLLFWNNVYQCFVLFHLYLPNYVMIESKFR